MRPGPLGARRRVDSSRPVRARSFRSLDEQDANLFPFSREGQPGLFLKVFQH